jgi:hypothetical protein
MGYNKKQSTEIARFHANIEYSDGCWIWKGYVMNAGYGAFATKNGAMLVHRWSYQHFRDKIPHKMTVDHLCKQKLCANPAHMELVTRAENIKRAGLAGIALSESKKTHCPKGHKYSEHGVIYKNGYSEYGTQKFARRCSICYPAHARASLK